MKLIYQKLNDIKYRHKLTILVVVASLVPMMVLVVYNHSKMKSLLQDREVNAMEVMLDQTRESIDSQIAVYRSLINYLTYSPEIEEVINNDIMDNYLAYEKYTQTIDPLLTVPKSYHDAILEIKLFATSIKVRHEYTLVPLEEAGKEWWNEKTEDKVDVQWLVNLEQKEIAAVRKIYSGQNLEAILCLILDFDKILQPFQNSLDEQSAGMVSFKNGEIFYYRDNTPEGLFSETSDCVEVSAEKAQEFERVVSESKETDWRFFQYRSKASINISVSQVLLGEVPLILLCVLIISVCGFAFSRLFTRRIEALTENMNDMNHGNRKVTVYSDSKDEVGILIRSFRSMMEEIDRLIQERYVNQLTLKEFELKALTAQINPHFLYNSLSIINWMAIRSHQDQISHVTLALSTFYRTALSKGAEMVTVESCIRNIEAYLQIQLVMHDNNFRVKWEIDPDIQTEMVPKLLMQPVVENALEHGLDEKEEGEKILKLYFVQDGEDILMAVEDNGEGMAQEVAEKLVGYQAEGYGLKNINDRVKLLYGDSYAIKVISHVGEGTRVEIRVPKGGKQDETK